MRIILTHEQTDFDGIASLLGAFLLEETAVPVLPRRINRNVRAFLTIYGVDLPFIDPRDLGDEAIDSVFLVDTQSLVSIKGMEKDAQIQVIDHHGARPDLPPEWEVCITEIGANATVFVEAIQERDLHLSITQATLLLMGIYEDTGSLTYARTTPRDVRAAAFLLEQGASLAIANDYLNHPLSLNQQEIYDQLRSNAESLSIHGHNIILASGDARETDEELSTIAHKMRDLLDPDAIFLLVEIRGGLQLVARSTSDHIDVAEIAALFGGGGHPRAAAALIKSGDRAATYERLIQILPDYIRPAVTVAELMSRDPQLLAAETNVQEIAERMQRFGYEGYPVVRSGKIIGLVTRRAVDRAISHKLNLTAEHLMDAGEYTITPQASIEELQTLMTNTGWGQIPVADPENGQIIGIVTRTDLLKTLAPSSNGNGRRNLAEKLEMALPPERLTLLKQIAGIAQEQRSALYIVGGFVRDLLLGYPSLDFDLVVEGDGITLARAVCKKMGGRVTSHKQFGTAKWFLELHGSDSQLPATLDFITARTEFYTHPTALPTVERGSIKLDLHRRDFTINTLALRLDGRHYGELHDYWGGYNDLRQGLVRVLHSISFVDDPTRMLRAARYEQRYGFKIGKRTLDLLLEARPLIGRVSGDRIRHEIDNILQEENAPQMLDRLSELGVLKAIHPDLVWDEWIKGQFQKLEDPPLHWNLGQDLRGVPIKMVLAYTLWLIRIPKVQALGIVKRLRLARSSKEVIQDACELWKELPNLKTAKPSETASYLEKYSRLAIYAAFLSTDSPELKQKLETCVTIWEKITPLTSGHELQALGLSPGPHFKEILNRLRAAWIDGEISNQAEELAILEKILLDLEIKK